MHGSLNLLLFGERERERERERLHDVVNCQWDTCTVYSMHAGMHMCSFFISIPYVQFVSL